MELIYVVVSPWFVGGYWCVDCVFRNAISAARYMHSVEADGFPCLCLWLRVDASMVNTSGSFLYSCLLDYLARGGALEDVTPW